MQEPPFKYFYDMGIAFTRRNIDAKSEKSTLYFCVEAQEKEAVISVHKMTMFLNALSYHCIQWDNLLERTE
jgi:hypothetical protein